MNYICHGNFNKGYSMAKTKFITKKSALLHQYFGKTTATSKKNTAKELNDMVTHKEPEPQTTQTIPPRIS
jgi:hypothetical protein